MGRMQKEQQEDGTWPASIQKKNAIKRSETRKHQKPQRERTAGKRDSNENSGQVSYVRRQSAATCCGSLLHNAHVGHIFDIFFVLQC